MLRTDSCSAPSRLSVRLFRRGSRESTIARRRVVDRPDYRALAREPYRRAHALIEPYVFDVIRYGRYDNDGHERSAERAHSYGNLTYILYGVTDRFTAGLIPTFGYNSVSDGRDSSSIQVGDVTLQGQYR